MEEQRGTTVDMTPDKREHSLNLIVLQDLIREQKAEIENLRKALEPFATLYLWPDDHDLVDDIRSDVDWNEDENDSQSEDLFILRGDIRRARDVLKGK